MLSQCTAAFEPMQDGVVKASTSRGTQGQTNQPNLDPLLHTPIPLSTSYFSVSCRVVLLSCVTVNKKYVLASQPFSLYLQLPSSKTFQSDCIGVCVALRQHIRAVFPKPTPLRLPSGHFAHE